MSADDRGRYRTPPRGVPVIKERGAPSPIDPEYTPPPFDISDQAISPEMAAMLGDTYRATRMHERRLITIGGEDGKGGILGTVVEVLRKHEDRLTLFEAALRAMERDRDLMLQRLEGIERLLEEQAKMISDIKKEQHDEKVDSAVTKWATRIAIGVLIFAATAVGNVIIGKMGNGGGTTTEIRYLPAPAGHQGAAPAHFPAPAPKTAP
jgi:hypothetical protein